MRWRCRFLVECFADLPAELSIRGHDVRISKVAERPDGGAAYLMDIFIQGPEIEEAHLAGLDLADEALDRIAYLSNATTTGAPVTTTSPTFSVGQPTQLCMSAGAMSRSRTSISSTLFASLDGVNPDSPAARGMTAVKQALAGPNPFDGFFALWRAHELLADQAAREREAYNERRCPKCSELLDRQPATQGVMADAHVALGSEHAASGDDAVRLVREARKFRGQLAHGRHLADRVQRERAEHFAMKTHPAVMGQISQATGVRPACSRTEHTGVPLTVFEVTLRDAAAGTVEYRPLRFTVKTAISRVPPPLADEGVYTIQLGVTSGMPIPEFGFPDPVPGNGPS